MNFNELLDHHPEITSDRHALSFGKQCLPADVARAFSRSGVVMLNAALTRETLEPCAAAFRRFIAGDDGPVGGPGADPRRDIGADTGGSWHSPWAVHDGNCFPAATVLSALLKSWAWDVVEELCGSSHIVVVLKFCTARHSIDRSLDIGAHQDGKVVASELPFSIWIPLNEIVPRLNSGLGFVVSDPGHLLPTLPHNDVGADYVLGDPARLWIPPYAPGDLTVHSRFSPHFTTGYGTLTDRFSLEIRATARSRVPPEHEDPALCVSRRNGVPTIVETRSSAGSAARPFLDSADLGRAAAGALRRVRL